MSINNSFDHTTYLSRFTWRYGSQEMREVFSEVEYRKQWREIWFRIAEAQAHFDLITREELDDIQKHKDQVDIERSQKVEETNKHDLVAELEVFRSQCPIGGRKLHLGVTSADIEDNADMLRIRKACAIIEKRLIDCLIASKQNIAEYSDLSCIGWTHLQPAEPTTVGYRFANYAQDLVLDLQFLKFLLSNYLLGKGIRGAVGTSASYIALLEERKNAAQMEQEIIKKLNLPVFSVSTQTYPRKADFLILSALATIAQSAHKFAFDVRILQSPTFGELSEPGGASQVGSSAMPHKRNPIKCERICSLSRYILSLSQNGWINASNALLERTLDDSANRHIILADAFLATDEILRLYKEVQCGIIIYKKKIEHNLQTLGLFMSTEPLLMKLVKKGADRKNMYERIRAHSQRAWNETLDGGENHLIDYIKNDPEISRILSNDDIKNCFNADQHIGDASDKCKKFVRESIDPLLI